ncbi:MAG: hypothetical protein ACTSQE_00540 [Candidatus Heimdallarchaeaceae archaeon]
MGLRIFSVKKDGTYTEVASNIESLHKENGAFIILDRRPKKIWIYRKEGIPSSLAYAAGRAATNLNARYFSSKYKIVNIEPEDENQALQEIFGGIEVSELREATRPIIQEGTTRTLISGEKTVYLGELKEEKVASTSIPTESTGELTVKTPTPKGHAVEIDPIIRALASQILFESNLEGLKGVQKPPKEKLRAELIKKLDKLLDLLYWAIVKVTFLH